VRDVTGRGITLGPAAIGELERLPSTVEIPPPPPPAPAAPAADLYRLVVFLDADRIDARGRVIQLAHVDAPAAAERCTNGDGLEWPCGMRARTEARRLVQRRIIACDPVDLVEASATSVVTTSCSVAGADISRWLVENGWAVPTADAPDDLRRLHLAAQSQQRGLYAPGAR
jgi:endonuclease YncB( thermonuclease family)